MAVAPLDDFGLWARSSGLEIVLLVCGAALATRFITCILPWWKVGGTPGITSESGTGLEGSSILVFLVGIVTLALVVLPYATRDRPVGLDRTLTFALLAGVGWIAFGWRVVELVLIGAFQFGAPAQVVTNGPGLWLSVAGLAIMARAAYVMTRESSYR